MSYWITDRRGKWHDVKVGSLILLDNTKFCVTALEQYESGITYYILHSEAPKHEFSRRRIESEKLQEAVYLGQACRFIVTVSRLETLPKGYGFINNSVTLAPDLVAKAAPIPFNLLIGLYLGFIHWLRFPVAKQGWFYITAQDLPDYFDFIRERKEAKEKE